MVSFDKKFFLLCVDFVLWVEVEWFVVVELCSVNV